jgi:uncharacterized membrane protein YgcG
LPAKNGKNGKNGSGAQSENFAAAITEVSERMTRLVHDEIELAKAEMAQKATSLARGAAAVAAGAVFGVFAVVFFLLTLAWVIDGIFVTGTGNIWLGFLVVLAVLLVLTGGAFLFAWKKLKVGAPTPSMAIDEAKKIRETVTAKPNGHVAVMNGVLASGGGVANGSSGNGSGNGSAVVANANGAAAPVANGTVPPPPPAPASTAGGSPAPAAGAPPAAPTSSQSS